MPDLPHGLLAEHAARSHGLAGDPVAWIAQGAYDEDRAWLDAYPPGSGWDLAFDDVPAWDDHPLPL